MIDHEFDNFFKGYDEEEIIEALMHTDETGRFSIAILDSFITTPDLFGGCQVFVDEFREWYEES